jgi:hypothetical protein
MWYEPNVAVCSEIRTEHIHNVITIQNFRMLNLGLREVTAGLVQGKNLERIASTVHEDLCHL